MKLNPDQMHRIAQATTEAAYRPIVLDPWYRAERVATNAWLSIRMLPIDTHVSLSGDEQAAFRLRVVRHALYNVGLIWPRGREVAG